MILQATVWRNYFLYIKVKKNVNFKCLLKISMKDSVNRMNRIIELIPLNGESLSGLAPEAIRFTYGSPNKFLLRGAMA